MKSNAKAVTCPYCGGGHSKSYLCESEFEGWEIDFELREKEDYAGLVAHYKAVVEWSGDGLFQLGDAYVLNGEPEKAIELLTEPYREQPRNEEYQRVIVDALFALGKDETDFDWVGSVPPVFRLDARALDRCHAYLKPKRRPLIIDELYDELMLDGFCTFTPEALLEALQGDPRFVVEEEDFWSLGIRARQKLDGAAKAGSKTTEAARC